MVKKTSCSATRTKIGNRLELETNENLIPSAYISRTSESSLSVLASEIRFTNLRCSCWSLRVFARLKQETVMNVIPIPKKAFTQIFKGATTSPTTVAPKEIKNPAQTRKFQLLVCESKLPGCIAFDIRETMGMFTNGRNICYACIINWGILALSKTIFSWGP